MDEDPYDVPWEYCVRPSALQASVAGPSSPPEETPSRRRSSRSREEIYVERAVDRVEAEKRLEGRALGDFLLRCRCEGKKERRVRGEGSVALSLRGSTSVLHIKLELKRQSDGMDKWVVGEGPSFRSISSAISYYRRHPLPIRGAEHLRLNMPLRPLHVAAPPQHAYLI